MTDLPRRWFSHAEAVNVTIFSPIKTFFSPINNTFPPGDAFQPHWPGGGVWSRVSSSGKCILRVFGLVVNGTVDAGQKVISENSGAGRHAGQCGLKKPADEFRLTAGSGFRENAICVGACGRLGDFEPRGGGEKPVSTNDFRENACLGSG